MIDPKLLAATIDPLQLSDVESLAEQLTHPPRPGIRLRPGIDPHSLPFAVERVAWHARGFFLPGSVRPGGFIAFAAGDYYVQDPSSLLPIALLAPRPNEQICDLCASPGGKSTAILEELDTGGCLLSNEAVESRMGMLQSNLARHGTTQYAVSRRDPAELTAILAGGFDAVLVDAPCSGQSLVARGKQSESAFFPRSVEHCAARQSRILAQAARLVRPGGRLVYATCTFAFLENEGQIEQFLQAHPDWKLDFEPALQPWESSFGPGHYRLWPHRHGTGGAYAARLVREGESEPPDSTDAPHKSPALRPAIMPEGFPEWGDLRQQVIFRREDQVFAWPAEFPRKLIDVAAFGPEIAFRKGSTWFPSYSLAMRQDPHWTPRATFCLEDSAARRYVAGESLDGNVQGWLTAVWRDHPLGWLKGDGRRLKNHLPKQMRGDVK